MGHLGGKHSSFTWMVVISTLNLPQRANDVENEYIELSQKLEVIRCVSADKGNTTNDRMAQRLKEITACVVSLTGHSELMTVTSIVERLTTGIKKQQERGKLARLLQSKEDADAVKTHFRMISSLLEVFQVRDVWHHLSKILIHYLSSTRPSVRTSSFSASTRYVATYSTILLPDTQLAHRGNPEDR
jgi:hypothetical protein